ncbi:MAG: 5-carboxymethyl-2-hydroxymuconate Delta-isomerase [Alphaproteobacteria bacterium]|nr:5-carboxymethyl-2-hydroxymuconate Delta-isomerase [Alphaproteobacteria bacterium]
MPHLILDYSANLDDVIDIKSLCAALRDAMVETGVFPLGGIRVRALPCSAYAIADGDPAYAYLHMTMRIGQGRDEETRLSVAKHLYATAEAYIKPRLAGPFALSIDLGELDPVTSLKSFNSIHAHLKSKELR